MSKCKIYFDGGCKPNPGMMEVCIILEYNGNVEPLVVKELGQGTNNLAEWAALTWAATIAAERNLSNVEFIGDSNNIVNQANRLWKIKEEKFLSFFDEFSNLNKTIKGTISYVPRAKNKAGIYLEHGKL